MMKVCELCSKPARMYCDSDQASLCWDCDARVHCANFLVAKHSRSLLCHVCQSPTPWKASGAKLGPTLSACEGCFNNSKDEEPQRRNFEEEEESESVQDYEDSEAESDEEEYSVSDELNEDDSEEEEDGENQVVPWSPSATPSSSTPPVATSSSSESTRYEAVSSAFKRPRDHPLLDSEDEEEGCCSSQVNFKNNGATEDNRDSFRAWKIARTDELNHQQQQGSSGSVRGKGETESKRIRRMETVSFFIRFEEKMVCSEHDASNFVRGITKLSRDAM